MRLFLGEKYSSFIRGRSQEGHCCGDMCHGRAVPLQILEDNTSRQHVPVREGRSLESVLGNWSLEIAIVSLLSVVLLGDFRPCTDHITVQLGTRNVIPCTDHITVQVVLYTVQTTSLYSW